MYKIYGDTQSGNCYKIQLLCELLDIAYEWIPVDILKGETQSEMFQAMSPVGKIPLLELADGRFLSESNAILYYLAVGTDFLPADQWERAKVLQWQNFEQYSHEPYIAVARYIKKYLGMPLERKAEYEAKQEGGHRALKVMEQQLSMTPYLTGETYTIADISLYAYTHVAHEGGFDLNDYAAIKSWLNRIANHSKHIVME